MAEELIGVTKALSGRFLVEAKEYTEPGTDGSGELTTEAIERSMHASLQRLKKLDKIDY